MNSNPLHSVWWEPVASVAAAAMLLTALALGWPAASRLFGGPELVDWGGATKVDLSVIAPGEVLRVAVDGRPVHVFHRTDQQIAAARAGDGGDLRFPEMDADRLGRMPDGSLADDFLIVYAAEPGGCVTSLEVEGFFEPCRGTWFDYSGRAFRGPAEGNLEVPAYVYTSDTMVFIGVD